MESLHVASKYEIEYGKTTCSPHWQGSLYNAFDILVPTRMPAIALMACIPTNFECPVESYDEAIEGAERRDCRFPK